MRECIECGQALIGKQVKFCCNACKQRNHYHRVKSQTNTYHSQTLRGLRRKIRLVELMGGCCSRCRYRNNLAVLQFHHISQTRKGFPLDLRRLSNTSWDRILVEAKKCILLCANCHTEVHNPEFKLSLITQSILGALAEKSDSVQWVNSGKPKSRDKAILSQAGKGQHDTV